MSPAERFTSSVQQIQTKVSLPRQDAEFCTDALIQTSQQLTGRFVPDILDVSTRGVSVDNAMPMFLQGDLGYGHTNMHTRAKLWSGSLAIELAIDLTGSRDSAAQHLIAQSANGLTPWRELEFAITPLSASPISSSISGEDVYDMLNALVPKHMGNADTVPSANLTAYNVVSAWQTAMEKAKKSRTIKRKTYLSNDTGFAAKDLVLGSHAMLLNELFAIVGDNRKYSTDIPLEGIGSRLSVVTDSASRKSVACDLTRVVPWFIVDQTAISVTQLLIPNISIRRSRELIHTFSAPGLSDALLKRSAKQALSDATPASIQKSLRDILQVHSL